MTHPLSLREQLKSLEHLQELDLKIDRLKKNKNALPAALKTLDDSLNKLRVSVDAKQKASGEIEKVQRQTTAALDLNRDRLARANTKLEAVHNSQEFQAASKEIEQLNKLNASLDEQSKKTSSEIEIFNKEIGELTAQMSKIQEERDAQAAQVSSQGAQLDSEINTLMGERGAYTSKVEPRILSVYDRIRVARGGLGIVPAVAGRCKGCNMMVPPQLYNQIQKGAEVHSCPSCHRILFVPVAQTSNENPSPTA